MRTGIMVAILSASAAITQTQAQTPSVCEGLSGKFGEYVCGPTGSGLSYSQGRSFEASEAHKRELDRILANKDDIKAWEFSVLTMGIFGYEDRVEFLKRFVTSPYHETPVPPPVNGAKHEGLVALGLLMNVTDNAAVKNNIRAYLINVVRNPKWIETVQWQSPFEDTPEELRISLVESAIEAMGLSGDPALYQELLKIREAHEEVETAFITKEEPEKIVIYARDALITAEFLSKPELQGLNKGEALARYYDVHARSDDYYQAPQRPGKDLH